MKKIMALVIAVVLLATLAIPSMAASGINDAEQIVVDKISQVVHQYGAGYLLKESDINHGKRFLSRDEINLTKPEAVELAKRIQMCYDIVIESGLKTIYLTEMTYQERRNLLDAANYAGEIVGVDVVWHGDEGMVYFNYQGKPEAIVEPTIKITGPDYTWYFVGGGAVVLIVAALAAALVVKKTARAK